MPPVDTIFQASDLNVRGRAILDAARSGEAHVRDKDGLGLVMLLQRRWDTLRTVARSAANLASLELALATNQQRQPSVHELGEWTWLREFDLEDLHEFVVEVRNALLIAGREEILGPLEETLSRWRVTAEALEDPVRRQILMGTFNADDFVEVERPK